MENGSINIPLKLQGIISYFNVRTLTQAEIEDLPLVNITSDFQWNPQSSNFEELEETYDRNTLEARNINSLCTQPYCNEKTDDIITNTLNVLQLMISSTKSTTRKAYMPMKWS